MRKNATAITLFNKYVGHYHEECFQRTYIVMVTWEYARAARHQQTAMMTGNRVTVYIPFKRGLNYVNPVVWKNLVDRTGKWTLQPGDIIARGLIDVELVSLTPGLYEDAIRVSQFMGLYDEVLTIASVDLKDIPALSGMVYVVGAN